jgi:transcription elongation GreA/GreB family factor
MSKTFSSTSVREYPENFILQNGERALVKELKTLPKNSKRRKEIKDLLKKIPVVKTTEQNSLVLPGSGVSLISNTDNKKLFCVLDGTQLIKKHNLPGNTQVILASSKLGRELLGKIAGENVTLIEDDGVKKFTIEKIALPSKSKWVFRFPAELCNN